MRAIWLSVGVRDNAQLETQLLAEWLATLPREWPNRTHVAVGAQNLFFQGKPLTQAQQRAFSVWSDWVDARVVTQSEVWLVEAKIVGTGGGYGQLLDYANQYPTSADYHSFAPRNIVPILLCAFSRPRTAALFSPLGIRTIVFTPSWSGDSLATKLFGVQTAG